MSRFEAGVIGTCIGAILAFVGGVYVTTQTTEVPEVVYVTKIEGDTREYLVVVKNWGISTPMVRDNPSEPFRNLYRVSSNDNKKRDNNTSNIATKLLQGK